MFVNKRILSFIFLFLIVSRTSSMHASCYKCELIREENKKKPPPEQEYYEDFIKAQKEKGEEPGGEIEFIDEDESGS